ncbi:MAG: two-component regulator propeller domain-containing protein, partial [Bacteroidota bacterium]
MLLLPGRPIAQSGPSAKKWIISAQKPALKGGLSHNRINAFHQDQLGFIWIGTNYGLNRYDGHRVQQFYFDQLGFASNRITHILEDAQGFLWLIDAKSYFETSLEVNQVIFWDPIRREIAKPSKIIKSSLPFAWASVRHFFQDKVGQLYFYTNEGQTWIYKYNGGFDKLEQSSAFFPIQASSLGGIWGQIDTKVVHLASDGKLLKSFELAVGEKCQLLVEGFQKDVHYKSHSVRKFPVPATAGQIQWKTALGTPLPRSVQANLKGDRGMLKIDWEKQLYWVLADRWLPFNSLGGLMIASDQTYKVKRTPYHADYLFDEAGMIWEDTPVGLITQKLIPRFFEPFLNARDSEKYSAYKVRGIVAGKEKMLVGTSRGNELVDLRSGSSELWLSDTSFIRANYFSFSLENDSIAWGSNHALSKINTNTWQLEQEIKPPGIKLLGMDAKNWALFKSKSGTWWTKKKLYLFHFHP